MKQYLNIPFKHIAGHDLCADFYIPEDVINPPVILWIHGGGWKDLNRKWCLVMPQLERGYAICSVDYRYSDEDIFPAQMLDLKDALLFVKENGEKYKIGMSMPTVQEEVWQIQMTLIEEDAEKRGYEAVILVADNDADRQIQQLQSLAAQGVDAIWVGAHDASMLGPVLTEIAEMGIPVVSQTRLPVDCPVAYHCNTDNTLLGQLHSQYIVDTLGITSGNFVILKDPR